MLDMIPPANVSYLKMLKVIRKMTSSNVLMLKVA